MRTHTTNIGFIFDLDGTLFRAETVTVPAVKIALQNLELPPLSKKQVLSGIGKATPTFYEDLLPEGKKHLAQTLQSVSSENEILFLNQGKGRLYPKTKKVLRQLKTWGYLLGLISNSNSRYFRKVIQTFALHLLFNQTLCAGETKGFRKKDLVKKMKSFLGVERIIVLGDRKEDIMAAKENGLQSIGCLYGYGGKEELEAADWKIKEIRELLSIFTPQS